MTSFSFLLLVYSFDICSAEPKFFLSVHQSKQKDSLTIPGFGAIGVPMPGLGFSGFAKNARVQNTQIMWKRCGGPCSCLPAMEAKQKEGSKILRWNCVGLCSAQICCKKCGFDKSGCSCRNAFRFQHILHPHSISLWFCKMCLKLQFCTFEPPEYTLPC